MANLPDYATALEQVLAAVPTLTPQRVALELALGRVLAEDVRADRDQPPFNRAAMDGFAVDSRTAKAGTPYRVTGMIQAGGAPSQINGGHPGGVWRIATGAAVPQGFDAVVPIEECEVGGTPGQETVRFSAGVVGGIRGWQSIHRQASDAARGAVVLSAGTHLAPHHLGIAAAVGAVNLNVFQKPRIALLTTGDEVRPPDTATADLQPQQIRNSNGPMLAAFLRAAGFELLHQEHLPDEPERTLAAAREALSHAHVVVTTGGVSVGQHDFLRWAWGKVGLQTVLVGAAIQPGRPIFVAGEPLNNGGESEEAVSAAAAFAPAAASGPPGVCAKLAIGLPGNPVSVLATAHLFLLPVLWRMSGIAAAGEFPRWQKVVLAEPVKPQPARDLFRAARVDGDGRATLIPWQGSGDLVHTAAADGWIWIPRGSAPVAAGTSVRFLPMVGPHGL